MRPSAPSLYARLVRLPPAASRQNRERERGKLPDLLISPFRFPYALSIAPVYLRPEARNQHIYGTVSSPPVRGFPLLGWDKSLARAGTREGRRSLISPAGRHIPLFPPSQYLPFALPPLISRCKCKYPYFKITALFSLAAITALGKVGEWGAVPHRPSAACYCS